MWRDRGHINYCYPLSLTMTTDDVEENGSFSSAVPLYHGHTANTKEKHKRNHPQYEYCLQFPFEKPPEKITDIVHIYNQLGHFENKCVISRCFNQAVK